MTLERYIDALIEWSDGKEDSFSEFESNQLYEMRDLLFGRKIEDLRAAMGCLDALRKVI